MLDATRSLGPVADLGHRRESRRKPVEYRLYFMIVFVVALPIAVVGRLFPRELASPHAAPELARTVWAEARAITDTVIPYLFMG